MSQATFDVIGYARELEKAGFSRDQAEIQARALRDTREAQLDALHAALKQYDELKISQLATKVDLRETELRLLKWQIGGWVALATIMAKGFGWLGF